MVKRSFVACVLVGIGFVSQACAQPLPPRTDTRAYIDVIEPGEAVAIARETGLTPLTAPLWRGGHYVMRAADRMGREYRVIVDARFGEIAAVMPLGPQSGPRLANAMPPEPVAPARRPMAAPREVATPLPRPRPAPRIAAAPPPPAQPPAVKMPEAKAPEAKMPETKAPEIKVQPVNPAGASGGAEFWPPAAPLE